MICLYRIEKWNSKTQQTSTPSRYNQTGRGYKPMILIEDKNLSGYELAEWLNENLVGEYITRMYSHSFETRSGYKIIINQHEGCMCCPNGWSEWSVNRTGENLGVVTAIKYKEAADYDTSDQFSIFIYLKSHPRIKVYLVMMVSVTDTMDGVSTLP